MYSLSIHPDAKGDLEDLWKVATTAASRVVALLEQIKADPRLLDALTEQDFGAAGDEPFTVSRIQSQWHAGKDLWRLKVWDLEDRRLPYRVIYAYEIRRQRYHVLGVILRSQFNYEPKHPFTQRILRAYDDVCG